MFRGQLRNSAVNKMSTLRFYSDFPDPGLSTWLNEVRKHSAGLLEGTRVFSEVHPSPCLRLLSSSPSTNLTPFWAIPTVPFCIPGSTNAIPKVLSNHTPRTLLPRPDACNSLHTYKTKAEHRRKVTKMWYRWTIATILPMLVSKYMDF
jgi:hypothetical protein